MAGSSLISFGSGEFEGGDAKERVPPGGPRDTLLVCQDDFKSLPVLAIPRAVCSPAGTAFRFAKSLCDALFFIL
jgi:hypothetical protein